MISDDNDKANARYDAAVAFFVAFLARGLEFCVRGNRLRLWPWKAWPWLTDAERAFITEHREQLKSIALSKRFGETQIVWVPPSAELTESRLRVDEVGNSDGPQPVRGGAPSTGSVCPYCMRKCVGRDDRWYRIFHWTDPEQVAKRNAEATAEMRHQVGRS